MREEEDTERTGAEEPGDCEGSLITPNAPRAGESMIIGQDILLQAAKRFLGFTPWKLALSFLVAGLGTLSLFYAGLAVFGSPLLKLRGLYSYYSATIGDGILLPIGVAVSTTALRDMGKLLDLSLNSKDMGLKQRACVLSFRLGSRALGWIPGGIALVVTASIHAAWLLNPRTEGNWTIVPGRLNFFGYWHAAFFFFALWWFLAFLGRLVLVVPSLLGSLGSQSLASASLRIWGKVNVFLAVFAGFASLLYIDNYGLRFSWQTLLASVTTLANLIFTTIVLLAVNLYFARAVYKPVSLNSSGKKLRYMVLLARRSWTAFALGCLLVSALVLVAVAVSASIAWPMAAIIAGVVLPVLFAENYTADLFLNQDRVPDSVECLGICLILVVSSGGLLTATALALQGSQVKTIAQMVPSWGTSLGVSLLTLLICIAVAWIASLTMLKGHVADEKTGQMKRKHVTDHTPMYNVVQNFLQYWGLFQLIVIPVAVFVYHEKAAPVTALSNDGMIGLMAFFSTCIIAMVVFPLTNNYQHLRDLEKRHSKDPSKYPSYHSISKHIYFMTSYVAAVTLLILGWLWVSFLDAMPKGK